MQILFILLLILALLFGLSSISQSYAAAQQAQAVIETARAAQIASAGNLVIIVTLALLLVAAIGVIGYLLVVRSRPQSTLGQWQPGPYARWRRIEQPDASAILPAMMSMLLYQMAQHQNQVNQMIPLDEPRWLDERAEDELNTLPDDLWRL